MGTYVVAVVRIIVVVVTSVASVASVASVGIASTCISITSTCIGIASTCICGHKRARERELVPVIDATKGGRAALRVVAVLVREEHTRAVDRRQEEARVAAERLRQREAVALGVGQDPVALLVGAAAAAHLDRVFEPTVGRAVGRVRVVS
ncbi:hypothetical protein BKA62DRAFT_490474 [Auriculariales sp. MPI-PUGE-AT-0066]|nr:hypothetical protein BKA62DRAFT_490474 [Auriculariales sp. MPI-PUGE-AT-0066]